MYRHEKDPIPDWPKGTVLRCTDNKHHPALAVGGTYRVLIPPQFDTVLHGPATFVASKDAPPIVDPKQGPHVEGRWIACWRLTRDRRRK